MKRKALLIWTILIAMTAVLNLAAEIPTRQRDLNLTFGAAIGPGFVENSGGELFALQIRTDLRWKWAYLACRISGVPQIFSSDDNPIEISILAGISLPFDSSRCRLNLGVGVGKTYLRDGKKGLPCELRFKRGMFALTAFADFNRAHNFYGVCVGFDVPILRG